MSEAGQEKKTTVIIHPDEMRALMRLGLRLSGGFGMSKTTLIRKAIQEYLIAHNEPVTKYEGPK